ncbi:TniQ family protein [Cupriavidus sp. P-10]|uniref:TniQ family protein n=1 Tax=Cupriavidus sp. P-10 TaxID=2027911 RepID=UPI000E2E9D7B|nr:TniQ family protein [Cupriavidus sp. P-10]BDB27792.1 TniQ family protein [Cupriavidus sp. P-10]
MSGMLYVPKDHPELYEIQWKGVGTSQLESLQSVFRRLAFKHRVTPGVLFNSYIKPTLQASGLKATGTPIALASKTFSIGADSLVLKILAERLVELTGEIVAVTASLIRLSAVLGSAGLACRAQQFCFECFAADLAGFASLKDAIEADVLFGRVLWSFKAVKACPIHGKKLGVARCGAPGEHWAKGPHTVQLSGVCPRCGSIGMQCQRPKQDVATEKEVWAASQVGALLSFVSSGGEFSALSLRHGIRQCIERAGKWDRERKNETGMTFDTVRSWLAGRICPNLQGLLALAAHSHAELVGIVRGEVGSKVLSAPTFAYEPVRPRGSTRSAQEVLDAYRELGNGGRVVSGEMLSKRLGVSAAYLSEKHSSVWELCQGVRNFHRRTQAENRLEELERLVREAGRKAIADGYSPTHHRVKQYLVLPPRYGGMEAADMIRKCFYDHL